MLMIMTELPADSVDSKNDHSAQRQANEVFTRNQMIEKSSLNSFAIRYPGLLVHAYFYYKFVERGEYIVGTHGHCHWEVNRILSGGAEYSIQGYDDSVVPDHDHYLIIPPKVTHGWRMTDAPLQMNSWQLTIEPEDQDGDRVLAALKKSVETAGFRIKASTEQIQIEELLWTLANKQKSAQLFAPVLCGLARVFIGDLLASLDPWPEGYLEKQSAGYSTSKNLAQRLKMFLDENLSHAIRIKEMEAHFHYSGRHLNRIFKEVYNTSVGHYLREQRIDLAKRWLGTTDRSIKDIALSLGYGDSGQFCRYFLKQSGLTPSQFRSSISIKQSVSRAI